MNNNNFEIKYTIRLYDPALIAELATQFEKDNKDKTFRNKNEFMGYLIALGLKENRKLKKENDKKADKEEDESNDIYNLLQKIFGYLSVQFRSLYIKNSLLEHLLCSVYNMTISLNNGERLHKEKIDNGYYDDIPPRCQKILDDLMKRYGLA